MPPPIRRRKSKFDDCRERIVELHALLWSSRRIALEVGVSHNAVCTWLKRLGLQSRGANDPEYRVTVKRQFLSRVRSQSAGRSPGTWSRQRKGIKCMLLGWPGAVTAADVAVCDHLALHGPSGTREMAAVAKIGVSGLTKVVRRLIKAELVVCVERPRSKHPGVWRLADSVRTPYRLLRKEGDED